jgi:hypothetical protein
MNPPATGAPAPRSLLRRLLSEPLVQFLCAGILIFAAHTLLHGDEEFRGTGIVVISEGRIRQISEGYKLLSGRPPTPAELEGLVEDFIDEEIAYQEAVALGLDADDTVVRRRMRQKLEFLVEDMEAISEPTEKDLVDWLEAHPDRFQIPARMAFEHALASLDKHGAASETVAREKLDALRNDGASAASISDRSLLPQAVPLTTLDGVSTLFGRDFATRLFDLRDEGWAGPVASSFGYHAVRITRREPARTPDLDEIRPQVRTDWIDSRRKETRKSYESRMRSRYRVTIDWPEGMEPAASGDRAPS